MLEGRDVDIDDIDMMLALGNNIMTLMAILSGYTQLAVLDEDYSTALEDTEDALAVLLSILRGYMDEEEEGPGSPDFTLPLEENYDDDDDEGC